MSRTDVHRPACVQASDPYLRREYREEHDHRSAPCDLDVFLATRGWAPTHCYLNFCGGRNPYCGCPMCTGRYDRKRARRKERAAWRKVRRQVLTAGVDSVDVLNPRPRRTW
jgi:hypothetical protein